MAQTVAVVTGTLPTTGGNTDFTSSGFGTPTAALIIANNANTSNNPQVNGWFSVGFWDGTNQRAVGINIDDNLTTTDTYRSSNDGYGAVFGDGANLGWTVTNAAGGDGINLALTGTSSFARYCTVILLKGVDSAVDTFAPNATQNSTETETGLSFEPKLMFFGCIGNTVADTAGAAHAIFSFGFAESVDSGTTINQRGTFFGSVDGETVRSTTHQLFSESYCCGQVHNDAISWTGEVTDFTADGFEMTTREGGSGNDIVFYLALGGDVSYDQGTLTTPTTTATTNDVATSVQPDAVLLMLGTADTEGTVETTGTANAIMAGITDDGTNEYSHNVFDEDNAISSNSESEYHASKFVNLVSSSSGAAFDAAVGTVTTDADGFEITYTTLNGSPSATQRKGWYVVFGTAAAAGGSTGPQFNPLTGPLQGPLGGPV